MILVALAATFIVFQLYISYNTNSVESQLYEVLEDKGEFEIRFYPSVNIAQITSNSKSYDAMSSKGFGKLAGYIFGGNDKEEKIAMTSPYDSKELPTPKDGSVKILKTDDEYVAALSFGGFANDKTIKENSDKLAKLLKENELVPRGNFRYLGYNPPFQLLGRKNEIVVKVDLVR